MSDRWVLLLWISGAVAPMAFLLYARTRRRTFVWLGWATYVAFLTALLPFLVFAFLYPG